AVAQPDAGGLTDDSLSKTLTGLGFTPKKLTHGYLVMVERDTWKINVQVVLSADLRKIGLNANLGSIANEASVTAAQWQSLLVSNGNIDPSAFYYDDKVKKLYLHRSLDNRTVTPASLSGDIQKFVGNVISTDPIWGKLTG
ncbi:unnamed protein product, partial [Phaeothamnion confervicola]